MKMLRNKNAPPTADLVQKFIDTAYDNVKLVADNLDLVAIIVEAINEGTFDDLLYTYDIDTFDELNARVLDAELATEEYVNLAVSGLYDHKGGYDADANIPDLDVAPMGIKKADAYTVNVGGLFYATQVDPGDVLIADRDDPVQANHWTIVNRNIDESAFATAEQGAKADTALQPGLVDNISELINNVGYTGDQTDEQIETAYNNRVALVSQAEAEAGVETAVRRWSPLRVAQAARAQAGAITFINDDHLATVGQVLFVDSRVKAITITLPAGTDRDNIWIYDSGHNASVNNITLVPDGTGSDTIDTAASFILDQDENFCNIAFKAADTDWRVGISGSPDIVESAPHTHVEADITDLGSYALSTGFPAINPQSGATYEFVAGDLDDGVTAENVAASTYSIPDSLGTPGDTLNLYNKGAGEVTIAMAGTDTLDTTDNNCAQGKAVTVLKIAATVWAVIGGTAAP